MSPPLEALLELLILAIPVATVTWTVTHEELFREPREWLQFRSEHATNFFSRKAFYLLTCEFCFSFYVSIAFLVLLRFHLLDPGWRGLIVAWFSLVWIANIYMALYARVKIEIRKDRVDISGREKQA